jgi:HAD superfamily hydrolase (TIGR01509 family)
MLRGVIFDMDGVLINSHPIHKRAWKKFFESLDLEITDLDLDFVLDGRKKEDILRHFLGDLPDGQIKEYGHRKEMLFREEALSIEPVEGALEFLEELSRAGIGFAVASCGSKSRVHYILRQLNIHDQFAAIVTADDVQCGKPHPDIFRKAADRLSSSYSDLLVCEDAISGVRAAKAAGIKCLGIADHARADELLEAGAERVVANFASTSLPQLAELFA